MNLERSFTAYIKEHHTQEIWEAANQHIQDNFKQLELHPEHQTRFLTDQSQITLKDLEIKQVHIEDQGDLVLAFHLVVRLVLEVEGRGAVECLSTWLCISCETELGHPQLNIHISKIENNNPQKAPTFKRILNDQLRPILSKEDLEEEAKAFLENFYPNALHLPQELDPYAIAQNIGLTIREVEISKDFSVYGQLYFHETRLDSGMLVAPKTILIDPRTKQNKLLKQTLIHECVHWFKHQKVFELERLYNANLTSLSFQTKIKSDSKTVAWMEWQARAMTPKILMPFEAVKKEAERLVKQDELTIEEIIDALARTFGVSRLAAKIRMVELGYDQAIGAFNFVDGQYVPVHYWKKGAINSNQTFCIDLASTFKEIKNNPAFAALIASETYDYVDSHFVRNHPKYIVKNEKGEKKLTSYAINHMDECVLVFDVNAEPKGTQASEQLSSVLNRDRDAPYALNITFHQGYENAQTVKQQKFLKEILDENERVYASLSNDPMDCLEKVRHWRNISKKDLAEKIPLAEKQIRRIFNGESNGSIETMVSICLALYLPPEISFHIIEKSNLSFKHNDEAHRWYRFALVHFYGQSLELTRRFLAEHGVSL